MKPDPPPIADPHSTHSLPKRDASPPSRRTAKEILGESVVAAIGGAFFLFLTHNFWTVNRGRPNSGWVEMTVCFGVLGLWCCLVSVFHFRRFRRERKRSNTR